ncbi:unnamed protein product [Lymnaea stagnalis]|uniref:G-protein coupled receptors family 1 profile domain-containing protein n=1 Tax=Lymnaea stagnalis TaxID=6523 RepID=A0AAV2HSA6_LYMST
MVEGCFCAARGLISLLGILGNLVNIKAYVSMGLSDGVTTAFLLLACSDLAYLTAMLARAVSFGFMAAEKLHNYSLWFPVDPYGVYIFFGNVGSIPYTVSILTTTLLAVVRCLSVARPLQFQNSFRRTRATAVVFVFAMFSLFSYLPVLVFMGMIRQFDARVNATRPMLWISPMRERVKDIVWVIRDAILPIATQLIVITCVIVMADCLRSASVFRMSQMSVKSVSEKLRFGDLNVDLGQNEAPRSAANPNKLIGKELQAVQQVLLISIIFIVCNMPKIVINFTGLFEQEFALGRLHENLYLTMIGVLYIFQTVYSSVNIFIYYHYSSKYRRHCKVCA